MNDLGRKGEYYKCYTAAAQIDEILLRFAAGSDHVGVVLYVVAGCMTLTIIFCHSSHRCLLQMHSDFHLLVVRSHQEDDHMDETVML